MSRGVHAGYFALVNSPAGFLSAAGPARAAICPAGPCPGIMPTASAENTLEQLTLSETP